jgi:hypothetical protein
MKPDTKPDTSSTFGAYQPDDGGGQIVPVDKPDACCTVTEVPGTGLPYDPPVAVAKVNIRELMEFYTPWVSLFITLVHGFIALLWLTAQGHHSVVMATIPVVIVSLVFTLAAFAFRDAEYPWVGYCCLAANLVTGLRIEVI